MDDRILNVSTDVRHAQGGVRTPWESLHWKLTLGEKSLAALGNRTCLNQRHAGLPLYQLSYIPTPNLYLMLVLQVCSWCWCVCKSVFEWVRILGHTCSVAGRVSCFFSSYSLQLSQLLPTGKRLVHVHSHYIHGQWRFYILCPTLSQHRM